MRHDATSEWLLAD